MMILMWLLPASHRTAIGAYAQSAPPFVIADVRRGLGFTSYRYLLRADLNAMSDGRASTLLLSRLTQHRQAGYRVQEMKLPLFHRAVRGDTAYELAQNQQSRA